MQTPYGVKSKDTLWDIANRELGDARRWPEIARLNQLAEPYLLYVGQTLALPPAAALAATGAAATSAKPTPAPISPPVSPTVNVNAASAELRKILAQVDRHPELRNAAVVLELPSGRAVRIRQSEHASGLQTVVFAKVELPTPADEPSWWARWNGVVLNCGGAAVGWVGVGLSLGAEVPSLGAATPLVVMSTTGALAASTQCGLAVARASNDDFAEYADSDAGDWINSADLILDLISLANGIPGAIAAVKGGGKVLKNYKHAKRLAAEPKGRLLKILQRMETHDRDLVYFRNAIAALTKSGKVADPALRGISNNIVRRSLPLITAKISSDIHYGIADIVGAAATTVSSYYGGAGSRNLGLVKVTVHVLQERVATPE